MFCDKCGEKLTRGSKFCESCGLSVIRSVPKKTQKTSKNNILKNYKFLVIFVGSVVLILSFVFYFNTFGEVVYESQGQDIVIDQKLDKAQQELEKVVSSDSPTKDAEMEELRKEIEELKRQQQSFAAASVKKDSSKLSNSEIVAKVKQAVVYIETANGLGSGMIIESDGYILTNAHVVEGVSSVSVKLTDGRFFSGHVTGRNDSLDLAIIKIYGSGLPVVKLGDSAEGILSQGDDVFALGYPFGLEGDVSFKEGTISRRHVFDGITYLETSAEIHPGNSGGPLVNDQGEVIGVNTGAYGDMISGYTLGETIKFAIPINFAKTFIPELKIGSGVVTGSIGTVDTPVKTCGVYEYEAGGSCYTFQEATNVCKADYGSHSTFSGEVKNDKLMCACVDKYEWNSSEESCVLSAPIYGSTVTIARRIVLSVIYNPGMSCNSFALFGDDLGLCNLYKNHKDDYNWNIVD